MAYFGKRHDKLKKSIIVEELGYEYFGITYEQWMQDIHDYKKDEEDGIIDPVCVDENENYYLEFSAPNKFIQRYYLDELKDFLVGNILIEEKRERK